MRNIGFSTGALAKGDFRGGIALQKGRTDAVELSALRESELDPLIEALPDLQLECFGFVSLHAPSRCDGLSERELVGRLERALPYVSGVVVHPDVIRDAAEWKRIESALFLENMDQRKPCARTVGEMWQHFRDLPQAGFCFDLGHARQVDPTLSVAVEFLRAYHDRLAEIHISEVNALSKHVAISPSAMASFRRVASLIPSEVPAIVESIIGPEFIDEEIVVARAALGGPVPVLSRVGRRPLQETG